MSSISDKKPESETATRRALVEQLQFLGQMSSTETALFHQLAAAKHGMSVTDSKTVSVLMLEGSMTAGQLATRLSLTTGAVTSVIDRLETSNMVHRSKDKNDRRKVIVELNYKKLAGMSRTYDSIGAAFQRALRPLTMDELRFLVRYYKEAIELTKQEIKKLNVK